MKVHAKVWNTFFLVLSINVLETRRIPLRYEKEEIWIPVAYCCWDRIKLKHLYHLKCGVFWFCYSIENDNLVIGLSCTFIAYFQWENGLSAWLCFCIDHLHTCILFVTQELLLAARDEYARQINSYVQPYAIYELGCIFLAKSEVCPLHSTCWNDKI